MTLTILVAFGALVTATFAGALLAPLQPLATRAFPRSRRPGCATAAAIPFGGPRLS
jgi:hypothetical protein